MGRRRSIYENVLSARSMARANVTHRLAVFAASLLLLTQPVAAQRSSAASLPDPGAASRKELDSLVARARTLAADTRTSERQRTTLNAYIEDLNARLRDGDFRPGDRVLLVFAGSSTMTDTFTVQPARTLVVPKLPAITLEGLLRSELQPYLSATLREYVRDSLVRAAPLVRVGVLGEVAHPGYYRMPLGVTLGDALMAAGGPSPGADVTRLTVRRGGVTLIPARTARDAMVRERSLADLGLNAGDELVVVGARQRNWPLITQIGGVATGLLLSLRALRVF